MVSQGKFRHDLFYRLNVVRIVLPSLRERIEDIGLLVDHFMKKYNLKFGKNIRVLSDDALKLFRSHTWPGNVRELQHAMEHSAILCNNDIIFVQNLPQDLIDAVQGVETPSKKPSIQLSLEEALTQSNGNKARAARLLGVSRPTVYRHLRETGE
jgi:transcriptional regulator with PAS, ATPase and Fis domain